MQPDTRQTISTLLLLVLAGCAGTQLNSFRGVDVETGARVELKAEPVAIERVQGSYWSPQWGRLELRSQGDSRLTGSFAGCHGACLRTGTLVASLEQGQINFRFEELLRYCSAAAARSGSGFFVFDAAKASDDRARLFGRHHYAIALTPLQIADRSRLPSPKTRDAGVLSAIALEPRHEEQSVFSASQCAAAEAQ